MAQQYLKAIFYINNSEIVFFVDKSSKLETLINIPYHEDLETLKVNIFYPALQKLYEKNKSLRYRIILIFSSDVLFEKKFEKNGNDTDQKINLFIDKIPFDKIVFRSYYSKSDIKLVAISRDFYENVIDGFKKEGFLVENSIPETVISDYISFKTFNVDLAKNIIKKFDIFKNSKLSLNSKSSDLIEKKYQKNYFDNLPKFYVFLGVFFLFAIFLVYLFYSKQIYQNKKNNSVNQTVILSNSTLKKESIKDQLKIEINYFENASDSANFLKSNLETLGYKNIDISKSQKVNKEVRLSISENVPEKVQFEIIKLIQKLSPDFIIEYNKMLKTEINISI